MSISRAGWPLKVSPLLNSVLPSERYVSSSPILKIQNHQWVQENAFSMAKIGSDKITSLKIALYKYPPLGRKRAGRRTERPLLSVCQLWFVLDLCELRMAYLCLQWAYGSFPSR